jgi:micrococcal nuclease
MLGKNVLIGFLAVLLLVGLVGCGADKKAATGSEFRVERIIDGDTIVLTGGRNVRYIGINTPEKGEPYYEEATEANRSLVEGKNVRLELDEEEKDLYGRMLAYAYVGDIFVNVKLVRDGYARAYPYPPNVKYQDLFSSAEKEAKQKGVGIWTPRSLGYGVKILEVNYDAEGNDADNLNGEWVVIINNTDFSANMVGFTLSDASSHVYTFGNLILSAGRTVTVLTGWGDNSPVALYWNSNVPVWNNDTDTAYLKDANGEVIDEYSY